MAPKGGQETQQRAAEVAFDQFSLASARFGGGVDLDPTKAGIQLSVPPEIEGVRHFHGYKTPSQQFVTGIDGSLDSQVSREARSMAEKIFEPIALLKSDYVARALAEAGLPARGASHEGSLESIRNLKDKFTTLALAA